ncbi:MAG: hypothetical protein UZ22_OP11002000758 [Microgenomates bacterium OLB23]|nr:MAG: hypothetical protein UZ22_OP11002000758 [Microgenomates bacterium OLB23]
MHLLRVLILATWIKPFGILYMVAHFSLTYEGFNQSRFAAHSDMFLVLLAPLYLLWPSPHTLNIFESLYIGLGAVPVFLIALRVLKNANLALLFAALYLVSPVVQWMDVFDFHSVTFAVPALLAAFYCMLVRRWIWYTLFVALALITKEHIGLQVFFLGLIAACVFNHKKNRYSHIAYRVRLFSFL